MYTSKYVRVIKWRTEVRSVRGPSGKVTQNHPFRKHRISLIGATRSSTDEMMQVLGLHVSHYLCKVNNLKEKISFFWKHYRLHTGQDIITVPLLVCPICSRKTVITGSTVWDSALDDTCHLTKNFPSSYSTQTSIILFKDVRHYTLS